MGGREGVCGRGFVYCAIVVQWYCNSMGNAGAVGNIRMNNSCIKNLKYIISCKGLLELEWPPKIESMNIEQSERHHGRSPLPDMVSLESFIVAVDHPVIAPPPTYKAYPIAILLHDHCAIYALPPIPPLYVVHHTILVMAISCKGQHGRLLARTEGDKGEFIFITCVVVGVYQ